MLITAKASASTQTDPHTNVRESVCVHSDHPLGIVSVCVMCVSGLHVE